MTSPKGEGPGPDRTSSIQNSLPSSNGQDIWFSSIKSEFDSPWQYKGYEQRVP